MNQKHRTLINSIDRNTKHFIRYLNVLKFMYGQRDLAMLAICETWCAKF